MNNKVNIDNINIHLSQGWQGDPVFLARKISEQFQLQAMDLHSADQLSISLQGQFAGNTSRITRQLSDQLTKAKPQSTSGRFK